MRLTNTGIEPRIVAFACILLSAASENSSLAQCTGTWTKRVTADAPSNRSDHAMAYDSAREVTVLFGGNVVVSDSDETWEWDGNNWSQQNPADKPTARQGVGLAYDSSRELIVLFGGSTGAGMISNETWEWDGVTWTKRTTSNSPSERAFHSMVFDSLRNVIVLFGGNTNAGDSDETWEWDGTNWSKKNPADAPSPRQIFGMAFDSIRGVTVLFGGYTPAANNETWEWDGTNWSQKMPAASPSARTYPKLAFDASRGVTVLFGGDALDDTWEWDGSNWSQRMPPTKPSGRSGHALAYDSARRLVVLFGDDLAQETWEYAGPLPSITTQPFSITLGIGQSAEFSVDADSPATITYRWRKNGSPLNNSDTISGTTSKTLEINPVAATDVAQYDCLISNPCGSIASDSVSLVVDECIATGADGDCNNNQILDACEINADSSLDANANETLDACESPTGSCGTCGGGIASLAPVTLLLLALSPRRRR